MFSQIKLITFQINFANTFHHSAESRMSFFLNSFFKTKLRNCRRRRHFLNKSIVSIPNRSLLLKNISSLVHTRSAIIRLSTSKTKIARNPHKTLQDPLDFQGATQESFKGQLQHQTSNDSSRVASSRKPVLKKHSPGASKSPMLKAGR